ncbi:hypothetical protein M5362_25740 [Streptomyces sp. Je 1-79]|uniref:hypothetical protein n=1 Tax=Streptomyces sp. Je 1-79 TaxID=2943847 RepID=UPI0021A68037|nr:hypothetical protein [Streptomyces sp. Je 1-79]MCT4356534.1 hypothetical protein [Streptomyces sp. Je 1-79]
MDTRDPARTDELKKELDATLHARRELGSEYESALIESFLGKVEQSLETTIDRQVRRRTAEQQVAAARGGRPPGSGAEGFGERYGFGIISLVLAIPLSAIAVTQANLEGLIVAWLGIAAVNFVHAFRGRLPLRAGRDDTDDF